MIGGCVGASDPTNLTYLRRVEDRITGRGLAAASTGPTICRHGKFRRVSWLRPLPAALRDGVSYRRGTFMAALEHGMPIVSTTPAVPYPDLLDGETLLLAPPGDGPPSPLPPLATGRPDVAARLGENARRLAARFTWESIAARSVEAYHRLLETRTS